MPFDLLCFLCLLWRQASADNFQRSQACIHGTSQLSQNKLVHGLDQRFAYAGLDVDADDPHVSEPLLRLDNAVLSPHLANATHETRQAMADLLFEHSATYFKTGSTKVWLPSLT